MVKILNNVPLNSAIYQRDPATNLGPEMNLDPDLDLDQVTSPAVIMNLTSMAAATTIIQLKLVMP